MRKDMTYIRKHMHKERQTEIKNEGRHDGIQRNRETDIDK